MRCAAYLNFCAVYVSLDRRGLNLHAPSPTPTNPTNSISFKNGDLSVTPVTEIRSPFLPPRTQMTYQSLPLVLPGLSNAFSDQLKTRFLHRLQTIACISLQTFRDLFLFHLYGHLEFPVPIAFLSVTSPPQAINPSVFVGCQVMLILLSTEGPIVAWFAFRIFLQEDITSNRTYFSMLDDNLFGLASQLANYLQ